MKETKKMCVLGAGLMGNDIARICAQAGMKVALQDVEQRFIDRGMNMIKRNLGRDVEKGRMTQAEADATLARIKPTLDLKEAARDADVVVDVIVEKLDAKKPLYNELDKIVPAHCLYLTNTLGLCLTEMAALTRRPEKVIGANFFHPVLMMRQLFLLLAQVNVPQTRLAA